VVSASRGGASAYPWPHAARHVLPSGVRILSDRTPLPVTVVATTYRAGFHDEHEDTIGTVHLIEHLMGRAARKAAAEESLGMQILAESRRDYSVIGAAVAGSHLEAAMRVGVVRGEELPADTTAIEIETAVIDREYLDLIEARPYGLFPRFLAARHLYESIGEGGTGYAEPNSPRKHSPESVAAFFAHHYTPARTVVSVVGDPTLQQVVAAAEQRFRNALRRPPGRFELSAAKPMAGDVHVSYNRPRVPVAVALAWRLPDPGLNFLAHVDRVLTYTALFAANGPFSRWLRMSAPGIEARAWWGAFDEPWDARSGIGLVLEIAGDSAIHLQDVAAALRLELPDVIADLKPRDLAAAATETELELTRRFDRPYSRARLLGCLETLFDGTVTWHDVWTALRSGAHDTHQLVKVVDGTGCVIMRCPG